VETLGASVKIRGTMPQKWLFKNGISFNEK